MTLVFGLDVVQTQLLLLHKRLRDLAAEKRVAAHHQIIIDNFVKKI